MPQASTQKPASASYSERVKRVCLFALLAAGLPGLRAAEPQSETVAAFDRYIKVTEDGFAKQRGFENFLWLDHHSDDKTMVWLQQSIVRPIETLDQGKHIDVPGGQIQHWLGAVYLENADADHMRGLLLNFDGYKDFFKEQILDSKLKKRTGDNDFDILLRFYKKQFKTVVLNVDESVHYTLVDPMKWTTAGHSTHIGQAEHPRNKKKLDEERAPEDAADYLWRLNFYWRVQQSDNGCFVELEVIALTPEQAGLLHPSHYMASFQTFPHDLTEYLIATLEVFFPHHK
jgi:hypothetical protein